MLALYFTSQDSPRAYRVAKELGFAPWWQSDALVMRKWSPELLPFFQAVGLEFYIDRWPRPLFARQRESASCLVFEIGELERLTLDSFLSARQKEKLLKKR